MEETVGISVFLTDTPGIGGRLRKEPEDFIVEEVSNELDRVEGGRFTTARIRSRNWETNRLVRQLARKMRISRRKVRFAGTKDKRAVTTQLFQFDTTPEVVRSLALADVEILDVYQTDERLDIGDLYGNEFTVSVKDIEKSVGDAYNESFETGSEILEIGGFPNFFGVQRFGVLRPVTHLIGRHIVLGDFEKAVMTYVGHPVLGENEETYSARKEFEEHRDFHKALLEYPDRMSFEKAILNHLVKNSDDFVGALGQLPENLLLMFVHAYQSYLFNRILSDRMNRGLPLDLPIEGDFVLPLDKFGLPDHDNWIQVKERNLEKVTDQVRRKRAFVSAVLFGTESVLAEGEMGEIERKVIDEEGVANKDFFVGQMARLSSKGTRREILAPLDEIEIHKTHDSVLFNFSLNKGCYATSLLREFMKTDPVNY